MDHSFLHSNTVHPLNQACYCSWVSSYALTQVIWEWRIGLWQCCDMLEMKKLKEKKAQIQSNTVEHDRCYCICWNKVSGWETMRGMKTVPFTSPKTVWIYVSFNLYVSLRSHSFWIGSCGGLGMAFEPILDKV